MNERDWREWFNDDLAALRSRRKELQDEIESLQRDALELDNAIWMVENSDTSPRSRVNQISSDKGG